MTAPTTYVSLLLRLRREENQELPELITDWHSEVEHIQSRPRWTFSTLTRST